MNCAICGSKLTKKLIDNPAGLARIDVYYCEDCLIKNQELHLGSKLLWEMLQRATTALGTAVDELRAVQQTTKVVAEGVEDKITELYKITKGLNDD